jgi:preprotein translocase subunit SecD
MMANTNFFIKDACRTLLLATVFALSACAGGYQTTKINGSEKVYRIDEQGKKQLVYEVDRDGNTVVHDASDPMAKQHQAAQQQQQNMQALKAQRIERLKQAPKRHTGDPIFVNLHPVKLGDKLKKAQYSKDAVDKQVRAAFKNDGVIRLVSKKDLKRQEWAEIGKALAGQNPYDATVADVEVVTRAYVKEIYGINKKTGKPDKMPAVVFEATITSNHLPAEYTVEESGHILRNAQVTQRFTDRIKAIITQQIGPDLPARQLGAR